MKKIMACAMALILALGWTALAESSEVSTLGILNPVITVDNATLLDLNRLDLELSAVSDERDDRFGVMVNAKAGESFTESVFFGQAVWDRDGISFSLDGSNALYRVEVPEPLARSGSQVRNMLRPSGFRFSDFTGLSAEQRVEMLEAMLEPYIRDSVIVDDHRILSFDISLAEGTLLVNGVTTMLNTVAPRFVQDSMLRMIGQSGAMGLRLNGKLSIGPDGIQLDSSGDLVSLKDGVIIPLVQSMADYYEGFTMTTAIGKNGEGRIELNCKRSQRDGGFELTLEEYNGEENVATGRFMSTPAGWTGQESAYTLDYEDIEGRDFHAALKYGNESDALSIGAEVSFRPEGQGAPWQAAARFDGKRLETQGQSALGGPLHLSLDDGRTRYAVDCTLVTMTDRNSDGGLRPTDGENLVNLTEGSRADRERLDADLDAATGEALNKLRENVPGMADFLNTLREMA